MRVFYSVDGFNWKSRYVCPADEKDPLSSQHYGMTTVRVTKDFHIGLLHAYNVEKQQIRSELIYSRNAMEWKRLDDRTPFFPNTETPEGGFFGMLFPDFDATPIREYNGDFYIALGSNWHQRPHIYFTYSTPENPDGYSPKAIKAIYGSRKLAERWPFFQTVGGWEGLSKDYARFHNGDASTIGFGRIRKNRWIAVKSNAEGKVVTRLWQASGRQMRLNGRGNFTVELLDADNNPLPGYSGAAAATRDGFP